MKQRKKIQIKKFILATVLLTAVLQLSYAQLLLSTSAFGINFASLAETFFWPECLVFLEIAAINVAAFLSKE